MTDSARHDAVFVSKRDWWISAILWMGVLVMACGLIPVVTISGKLSEIAFVGTIALVSSSFMIWVLYGTKYIFRGPDLVIRSGPFRWRVKVNAIRSVEPTNNPLSSPACSLDRLRIEYEGSRWGIMISPLEKEDFLDELVVRNPALVVENGRVVKRLSPEAGDP